MFGTDGAGGVVKFAVVLELSHLRTVFQAAGIPVRTLPASEENILICRLQHVYGNVLFVSGLSYIYDEIMYLIVRYLDVTEQ